MIRKVKGKYNLYSKKTKKKLGSFRTKKAAIKRERQINFFKHKNKK